MRGAAWPLGDAPTMVMAPIPGRPFDVDRFVQHHILDMGFTGVLRYLQGQLPGAEDRRLCVLADEHGFWVHFVMYGDVQSGTAPDDALGFGHNKQHQHAVVDALAPHQNWSMGCGFDNSEWVSDNEGNRWVRRLQERAPGRLFSIRVRPDESRRDPDDFDATRLGFRPGGIASFEQQILDKARFPIHLDEAIRLAGGRPVGSLDRFRVRPGDREKDFQMGQVAPGIRVCREHNVASAWGAGDNVSDDGADDWPAAHRAVIRAALLGEPPPPPPQGIPALADITLLHPGTPTMLTWPVQPGPVGRAEHRDGETRASWPHKDWPAFHTIGDTPDDLHVGTLWIIYWDGGGFVGFPAEHLKDNDRERERTAFKTSKLPDELTPGSIVGFIVAGPSRHAEDRPEFRRRTAPSWFRWGDGELAKVEPDAPGEPAAPDEPAEPENPVDAEIPTDDNADGGDQVTGSLQPAPRGDDMQIINPSDMRSFRVRLGGSAGSAEAATWPADQVAAEIVAPVENDKPWVLYAHHIFIGMQADKQDEVTVSPFIVDPQGDHRRPLPCKHIAEKDSPGMAFDASEPHFYNLGIRLPAGGQLGTTARHWVVGDPELGQEEAHQVHVEVVFYAYVEPDEPA